MTTVVTTIFDMMMPHNIEVNVVAFDDNDNIEIQHSFCREKQWLSIGKGTAGPFYSSGT